MRELGDIDRLACVDAFAAKVAKVEGKRAKDEYVGRVSRKFEKKVFSESADVADYARRMNAGLHQLKKTRRRERRRTEPKRTAQGVELWIERARCVEQLAVRIAAKKRLPSDDPDVRRFATAFEEKAFAIKPTFEEYTAFLRKVLVDIELHN